MGPDDTTEVTETSDSDEATSSDSTDETSAPQVRAASRRRASSCPITQTRLERLGAVADAGRGTRVNGPSRV